MAQGTMSAMALPNNIFRSSMLLSSTSEPRGRRNHLRHHVRFSHRYQRRPAPEPSTLVRLSPAVETAATGLAQSSLTPTTQEMQHDARLCWKARLERLLDEESLRTLEATEVARKDREIRLDLESLDILHCLSDTESLRTLEAMELARKNWAVHLDHESLDILERETAKLQGCTPPFRPTLWRQPNRRMATPISRTNSSAEADSQQDIFCPKPQKAHKAHLSKLEMPFLEPEKSVEGSLLEAKSQKGLEAEIAEAIATPSKKSSAKDSSRRILRVCNPDPEPEASIARKMATPSKKSSTNERSRRNLGEGLSVEGMTTPSQKSPLPTYESGRRILRLCNPDPELEASIVEEPATSSSMSSKDGNSTPVSQVLGHGSEFKSWPAEAQTTPSRVSPTKRSGFWSRMGFGSFGIQARQLCDQDPEDVQDSTLQTRDKKSGGVSASSTTSSAHETEPKDLQVLDQDPEHGAADSASESSNESKGMHTPLATSSTNDITDQALQVLEEDSDDDTDSASDINDETGAMSSPLRRYLATENSIQAHRVLDRDSESSDDSEAMSTPSKKPSTNESNRQSDRDLEHEPEDDEWTNLEHEHNDWTDLGPESQILFRSPK